MFKKRKTKAVDYPVMPLEGLWWVEDGMFDITIKDNWFFTLMILQPDIVTQEIFEEGLAEVSRKRGRVKHCLKYGLNLSRKAYARRSCTSVHTPPNRPPLSE